MLEAHPIGKENSGPLWSQCSLTQDEAIVLWWHSIPQKSSRFQITTQVLDHHVEFCSQFENLSSGRISYFDWEKREEEWHLLAMIELIFTETRKNYTCWSSKYDLLLPFVKFSSIAHHIQHSPTFHSHRFKTACTTPAFGSSPYMREYSKELVFTKIDDAQEQT